MLRYGASCDCDIQWNNTFDIKSSNILEQRRYLTAHAAIQRDVKRQNKTWWLKTISTSRWIRSIVRLMPQPRVVSHILRSRVFFFQMFEPSSRTRLPSDALTANTAAGPLPADPVSHNFHRAGCTNVRSGQSTRTQSTGRRVRGEKSQPTRYNECIWSYDFHPCLNHRGSSTRVVGP